MCMCNHCGNAKFTCHWERIQSIFLSYQREIALTNFFLESPCNVGYLFIFRTNPCDWLHVTFLWDNYLHSKNKNLGWSARHFLLVEDKRIFPTSHAPFFGPNHNPVYFSPFPVISRIWGKNHITPFFTFQP